MLNITSPKWCGGIRKTYWVLCFGCELCWIVVAVVIFSEAMVEEGVSRGESTWLAQIISIFIIIIFPVLFHLPGMLDKVENMSAEEKKIGVLNMSAAERMGVLIILIVTLGGLFLGQLYILWLAVQEYGWTILIPGV